MGSRWTRFYPDPSLTERVMLMVTWTDIFAFITMLVTIAIYIDTRHKK